MDNEMLQGFNPGQKAAVEYCDGPSLVIAGADDFVDAAQRLGG